MLTIVSDIRIRSVSAYLLVFQSHRIILASGLLFLTLRALLVDDSQTLNIFPVSFRGRRRGEAPLHFPLSQILLAV